MRLYGQSAIDYAKENKTYVTVVADDGSDAKTISEIAQTILNLSECDAFVFIDTEEE